ncbi:MULTISPECIES: TonB-dependent receptor [Pseudomonas]|uniref:Ligand-gated channel n=1 Tax=Pseudomonas fulva TaxID=47880 RepID=A0A0D0JTR8_9PSED|nr:MULTISPECIES: TonB-dependent receptor [Pseudomonas]KIP89679.1 ligand-gated channel [Pseudomonas fulva]
MRLTPLSFAILCSSGLPALAHAAVDLPGLQVTASKRETSLAETDMALSVAEQEDLQRANIGNSKELNRVFPELFLSQSGLSLFPNLSLRGISSADAYSAPVAFYVDGVPYVLGAFNQQLLDIERIELLKGPQGTLYGRNAHAGALSIVTRRPENAAQLKVGSRVSNLNREVSASVSGALVEDRLLAEAAVFHNDLQGELKGSPQHGDGDNGGGRVGLTLLPNDDLSVRLIYARDRLTSHEERYLPFHGYASRAVNPGWRESSFTRRVETSSAVIDWSLGDAWKLTSTSALQSYRHERLLGDFGLYHPERQSTLSQELRLTTQGEQRTWDANLGLYWQDSKTHSQRRTAPGGPYDSLLGLADSRIDSTEKAVFGEFTWHIDERWDLTLGARHSREEASTRFVQQDGLMVPGFAYRGQDRFNATTPKIVLGFQASDDLRIYALASEGYKPGGFNRIGSSSADAVAYDPERSLNLEAGFKASLLERRLFANASLYWMRIEDVQQYIGMVGIQNLQNMGDARSEGAELSLDWLPDEDTRLHLAGTINRSRLVDADVRQGNRLALAPRGTLRLSAERSLRWDGLLGELRPSVGLSYVGQHYFDADNQLAQGGYTLFDARLTWQPAASYQVALYGNNLTAKDYRSYAYLSGADAFAQAGQGRELGVDLSLRF